MAKHPEVRRYLDAYVDTPLADRLRRAWVRRLAKDEAWPEILEVYRPLNDVTMRCLYVRALYETGDREAALNAVEPIWLVGKSQPSACDPVFAFWRKAGRLTPELVWERIELAMRAGRTGLAKYLARFLPKEEQRWVNVWRKVRSNPALIRETHQFQGDHPVKEDILVYGIRRLARRSPDQAAGFWETVKRRHQLSELNQAAALRHIGLSFAYKLRPEALDWLGLVDDDYADARIHEWRVLTALRAGEWKQVLDWLERMDPSVLGEDRWRFWYARALHTLGEMESADALFEEMAEERSYYGFLAADRLGEPYNLGHKPLDFAVHLLAEVENLPGVLRARELYVLGRHVDARREWRYATVGMSQSQLARAAKLAHNWGWHDRAIMTVARTAYLDDLELRFPLGYQERVLAQAAANSIEPAWVFAILRQESAFTPDARSPKGALGLMQIMPGTGKRIAKSLNTRLRHRRQLLDEDTNIRFGSAYLKTLLNRLNANPALATAAYNAGPHRVERWLPDQEMDFDRWIETVPFFETRDYLKRVFTYTAIYEDRLGRPPARLSERLGPVPAASQVTPKS